MRFVKYIVPTILLLMLSGCHFEPNYYQDKMNRMTTRVYDADYDVLFNKTVKLLHSKGFIIKSTDRETGVVYATSEQGNNTLLDILFVFSGDFETETTLYEVSAMVNPVNDEQTEIKLNIQETHYVDGYKEGSNPCYDEKVYEALFKELEKSMNSIDEDTELKSEEDLEKN